MTTNNHPAHGPVSLDRLHQIREILSKAAAQSDGGNLGYAMADAVKVIDDLLEVRKAENVGEVVLGEYDDCGSHPDAKVVCIADDGQADWENFSDGTRLYAVPPAPVSIDERAAFNAWNNDENLPIAGVGAKNAAWLAWQARAAMPQAGNSPVIPDGYVLVPKEMTPEMMRAVQIKSELGAYTASELSGAYDMFREFWGVAVTSAPLYTAPSELVTPDGSTCKYCGGTGYFRWQKSAETFPCPCVGCDLPSAGGK